MYQINLKLETKIIFDLYNRLRDILALEASGSEMHVLMTAIKTSNKPVEAAILND